MPYPQSPFATNFNTDILLLSGVGASDTQIQNLNLVPILKWLCTAPKISSYRINAFKYTVDSIIDLITEELERISTNFVLPKVYKHELLPEVVLVENYDVNGKHLISNEKEIIVDINCAAAILRGAHIFAPGVMGMVAGINIDDEVSIYADVAKNCNKGYQKLYDSSSKIFIATGIAKMTRNQLFGENVLTSGIAVEITHSLSGCPTLGTNFLPKNAALLQNIPSIICTHVLNPQGGEVILDMCASPGNKTTHISTLMKNFGILIAIDKTTAKVKQLEETCKKMDSKVYIFQADSTKIWSPEIKNDEVITGPPFSKETFDKILLDAPCSALGKRPQLLNNSTEKSIRSFVPLQRKLFQNAVNLLKINGTLVYSTCTITLSENESMVAWVLKTFDCIDLIKSEPYLGCQGWPGSGLTDEQLSFVQRFGPEGNIDSVGFFIAKFVKTKSV